MNILVIDKFADIYKKAVEAEFPQVEVVTCADAQQAMDHIADADVLLCFKIGDELVAKAKNLKWIQALTTGSDYIVALPSLKKETLLTTTRGIHGIFLAEMAAMQMLMLARHAPMMVRNQVKKQWIRKPAGLLDGQKAVIWGMGVCGSSIGRILRGFNMEVHGIGSAPGRTVDGIDHYHTREELHDCLKLADYFIIVAPNTPGNFGLIDEAALRCLRPEAFLINIGRGEVVDEDALYRALKEGWFAGAALDTFITEPLPQDNPFWDLPNVLITPHVAGLTDRYPQGALSIFMPNLRAYLAGEKQNIINVVEH